MWPFKRIEHVPKTVTEQTKLNKTKTTINTFKVEISIGGMSCASCANAIERNLKKMGGVETVNVNLITEVATVYINPLQTNPTEIANKIKTLGYEATRI
jgi:Cu+-exporting ATPase